jgi:hypothetical protein
MLILSLPFHLESFPRPWRLEEFRVAVERHRGRRLILEPAPLSRCGSAMWIAAHAADLIVYDQAAEQEADDFASLLVAHAMHSRETP